MGQHASAELQELDFLVMTAVKQNGLVLQNASPRLQDADMIVSTAVKQNGLALQYASSRLQDTDKCLKILQRILSTKGSVKGRISTKDFRTPIQL